MIDGITVNFKYQGSEQEVLLPQKKYAWRHLVELLQDYFHLPKDCDLYLTYVVSLLMSQFEI